MLLEAILVERQNKRCRTVRNISYGLTTNELFSIDAQLGEDKSICPQVTEPFTHNAQRWLAGYTWHWFGLISTYRKGIKTTITFLWGW